MNTQDERPDIHPDTSNRKRTTAPSSGPVDNLATTVPIDDYRASPAEDWLGVPADEVLSDARPLELFA